MKITELRIGDKVQTKRTQFPMVVVGVLADTLLPINPNKGTVQLDFYGNEGDVWEENIEDLEFCEPRYKLLEWKKDEDSDSIVSSITTTFFTIEYVVDEYSADSFCLFFSRNVGDTTNCKRIGVYSTLAEAQGVADKHYNELVSKLIEEITNASNNEKD